MKAAPFDYVRARDAAQAVSLLAEAGVEGRAIAGGQSLGPMLNLRLARPRLLVDVRCCEDMRGVVDEGDALVYGAAVTHAEIEDGAVPDALGGALGAAARRIAYRAVRNRGTVGGSLAHADPAADWPVVLLAAGAEALVQGAHGVRAMPLAGFLAGPFATALAPGEVLLGVRVRRRGAGLRWGYRKVAVKVGEFARAFSVVLHDAEADERRAVVGAIERAPLVLEGDDAEVGGPEGAAALIAERLPALGAGMRRLHAATLARAAAEAAA